MAINVEGQRVALKVGSLHDRKQFEREIAIMQRVNHPHLVILDRDGEFGWANLT